MSESVAQSSTASATLRRTMVDRQIHTFDVTDTELLAVITDLPREPFLPPELTPLAYSDSALAVGRDASGKPRRLLAPMVLARLIQAAQVRPGERALDLAGGGGYSAALMARLGAQVVAVEDSPEMTARARLAFASLGIDGAQARTAALLAPADGQERFDVILVNGAVERRPDELLALMADGGRLLAIWYEANDASGSGGSATMWTRSGASVGAAALFNANAPILRDFARRAEFAF